MAAPALRFRVRVRVAAIGLMLLTLAAAGEAQAPDSAEIRAAILQGYQLLDRNRPQDAIREFKTADKLAGGSSPHALVGLALAYNRIGSFSAAEKSVRRALELPLETGQKIQATNTLGIVLFYRAGDKRDRLEEAESVFRAALDLSGGDDPLTKYNLAEVLLKLGRDDEGLDLLEEYLATDPTGPNAVRARSLVDDPRRARENLLPDFRLVGLDGNPLTPADLAGKVVLLDFWATWCGPCRMATPFLVRLHERHHDEPFAIVGVSVDAGREEVEAYVREHELGWTQAWDRGGASVRDSFRVRSYPTYLLVDPEGRVILRLTGWSDRISTALSAEVKKAIRQAGKSAG